MKSPSVLYSSLAWAIVVRIDKSDCRRARKSLATGAAAGESTQRYIRFHPKHEERGTPLCLFSELCVRWEVAVFNTMVGACIIWYCKCRVVRP